MPTTLTREVYEFSELSEDAQEKAIEWYAEKQAEWLENDEIADPDYWIEEWLEPEGIEPDSRTYNTMGGKTRSEPAIYWTTYPKSAYFDGMVDLETYIKKHSLGRSHALLLSAVRRGECSSRASVSVSEHGRCECQIDIPGYQWGDSFPRYSVAYETGSYTEREERLEHQADDLQEKICQTASDIASKIANYVEKEYEYRTSEEYARESLLEGTGPEYWNSDGTPA